MCKIDWNLEVAVKKIDTETMKGEVERGKGSDQSSGTKCRSKARILEGVVLLPTQMVFWRHWKQSGVRYVLYLRQERVPGIKELLNRRIRLSVLLTRPCPRSTGVAS